MENFREIATAIMLVFLFIGIFFCFLLNLFSSQLSDKQYFQFGSITLGIVYIGFAVMLGRTFFTEYKIIAIIGFIIIAGTAFAGWIDK